MTQTINNNQNGNINSKADISAIEAAEEIKLNDLAPEQQLELEKLKLDLDMASDADKEADEVTKTPPRRLVIVDGGKVELVNRCGREGFYKLV